MQMVEVARFERNGDIRTVSVGEEDGCVVVREDLFGPTALAVYGDEERSHRLVLPARSASALLSRRGPGGGEGASWGGLAGEDWSLADLMDLCDREGVEYSFCGVGSSSGLQLRA